ncbi:MULTISPECIES: Holliday junction resolvase RecU [Amylolactobacillus]|nr:MULTISPECIES: Holliday junction resolvase RecU [Amylolactobacillus]APT19213.1 Holliday junction resolvase RecU [Amylolactobacillus amylophilus DSM 20533 = JCM 1125]GED79709.1 Holliday junction resolvase RecU [Amylolactobacillus amylophilus]
MVKYPNGNRKEFHTDPDTLKKSNQPTFSRRGMTLEEEINESNEYYLVNNQAVIYKKPTPIQIVSVDYPKRSRAVIKEAYFRQASTTDYNGVYRGYYVDFEAKETKNKLSFPLKNFHQHQIEHFKRCLLQDGICFVIIKFSTMNRYFVTPASLIIANFEHDDDQKSIKLTTIEEASIELSIGYRPTIPYLDAVDQLIKNKGIKTNNDR